MKNPTELKNKVVLISGGGGALGGAVASFMAQKGARVVIIGRTEKSIKEKEDQINDSGGLALGLVADVLSQTDLEQTRDKILAKWGSIDILINAAGGNKPGATIGPDQTIFDLSIDHFNQVTALNLNGTVLPSLVFGAVMKSQGAGAIINFSSMAVNRVLTRVAGYSASKAAMENFTRWMAVEVAMKFGESIRVNAIAPGFFIGDQNRDLLLNEDGTPTDRGQTIIRNTPMGRFGEADEINGAVEFLSTSASKFVTGIVIPIDGGFSAFSGV
ncbi:MAG: SDR family oxidoreductase [Reichenbachiella sp.]|uniref:SDR family oxidoreductase n=1 Tax=Reichenbachiella sp. TaxID=2184521 RepID=UPI0032630E7C